MSWPHLSVAWVMVEDEQISEIVLCLCLTIRLSVRRADRLLPLRTGRGSSGIGTRGPGFFDRRKASPSVVGG
jgi:hypothetical protein